MINTHFGYFFKKNQGIKETPNKVLLYGTIQDQNVEQSRIGNPFALIRRYSSKKHFSFLDYHTELSYCPVDVTVTAAVADLGPSQKSLINFCKKTAS